jgi:hypothetical protein
MAAIAHVLTLARIAEILGEDEDLLYELSTEMEPEDGVIAVHGVGDDYTPAFTQYGIENLRYLIELHKADALRASEAGRQNVIPSPDRPVTIRSTSYVFMYLRVPGPPLRRKPEFLFQYMGSFNNLIFHTHRDLSSTSECSMGASDMLAEIWQRLRHKTDILPRFLSFINDAEIGRDHEIGRREKLQLLRRFWRNRKSVESLCSMDELLELASAILRLPRSVHGDIVECGCYVGSMSVNLSLVCRLVGRRLILCDSFQGLPEPSEYDKEHYAIHTGHTDEYWAGRFAASIDLVKGNLRKYGDLDVCDFVVGFYDQSLKGFNRPTALAFLDVDLIDSVKPCIEAIWPNLSQGSRMYVHEARSLSIVAVFFDNEFWRATVGEDAPGFVAGGIGLPLSAQGSELGYAQKRIIPS